MDPIAPIAARVLPEPGAMSTLPMAAMPTHGGHPAAPASPLPISATQVPGVAQNGPSGLPGGYKTLSKCRELYEEFMSTKQAERDEQRVSERYYHGAHWTAAEIKILHRRRQPVITYNRIQRKIDGVVGLIERLRQDPKAYPRTPAHEDGAELATACLRYVLDSVDWRSISPEVAHDGGVIGIGGVELDLEDDGRGGNPRIILRTVDAVRDYFYDPRSMKADFSDARDMGVSRWLSEDEAIDMFPDHADDIKNRIGGGDGDGVRWDDRKVRWINTQDRSIRIVEHWYRWGQKWCWQFYSGNLDLGQGESPFIDENGKQICRFIMYATMVDHDGDRYGFIRNLKGPQDEINQRRSKGLHLFNSRRIIAGEDAVKDIEKLRIEAAAADGIIIKNPGTELVFDDAEKAASAAGNLALLTEAKAELENFGPNPALIGQGTGIAGSSGRAIALLQQAGIAELGPYILRYRGWKLRVYRAVWNAIVQYWTGEMYIRVTDSEEVTQFIAINKQENTPLGPQLVNQIGQLDVDIILDEGPDQINSMADAYDTLIALSTRGAPVPPELILELSALPASVKKRIQKMMEEKQQPDPQLQQAKDLELQNKQADTGGKVAKANLDQAKAKATALEAHLKAAPFIGLMAASAQEQAFQGPPQDPPVGSAPPGSLPPEAYPGDFAGQGGQ
jgi:hypothetical protein